MLVILIEINDINLHASDSCLPNLKNKQHT